MLRTRASRFVWITRLMAVTVAVLLALVLLPSYALARDYSIDQVDIEATVATDGSLSVKEVREFNFDGSFHGVYWKIPRGSYQGRSIDVSILSVGEIIDGRYVEFSESYSGSNHTYELSEYSSYVQVKLYSAHQNESAQFAIVYRDTNLATRYDDTSELYWKFVSDGWDVESKNVTCTIHLPIPSGQEVIPGDNVRAWGHGPLDATVGFSNGDVVYLVPGVGGSEFAEARITFPAEWLSDTTSVGYSELDYILSQEESWAAAANRKRQFARILIGGTSAITVILPILTLVKALFDRNRYKQEHKALFDDKYFRDVPTDDHPAVLGALLNKGNATDEGLTASLMRLTDEGYAKLELVKYREKGLFGREKVKEDYCLTPLRWPSEYDRDTNTKQVDYATMRFLFQQLAPLAAKITGDRDVLYFGNLEKIARSYPESYDGYRKGWEGLVEAECRRRSFFADDHKTSGGGGLIVAGIVDVLLAIVAFFALIFMGAPFVLWFTLPLIAIACGVIVIIIGATFEKLSQEALEIIAKLKALKRWLKDFTRLEEAIPRDVVLWDRLLVMAVVLGVADEVIEQLRMAAPELLQDAMLSSTYGWYYASGPSAPMRSFTNAVSSAHSVSTASLASSSSSSGGGGGGGFSGGGGGGFGGGGGGGAF